MPPPSQICHNSLTNKLRDKFEATVILSRWSALCLPWFILLIYWYEFCFSQKLLQFLLLYIYNLIPVQLVCPAGDSDGGGSGGGAAVDLAAAVAVDHLTSRLVLSSFTDHFRRPRCSLMMAFPTPPTIWKRILLIFCRHGTVARISRFYPKIIKAFWIVI